MMKPTRLLALLLNGLSLPFSLSASIIFTSQTPNFPPPFTIGSPPGAEYQFTNGWTIKDLRISNIHLLLTDCLPYPFCIQQDCDPYHPMCTQQGDYGWFDVSATINGSDYRSTGTMQMVTVTHGFTNFGPAGEVLSDFLVLQADWMRFHVVDSTAPPWSIFLSPDWTMNVQGTGGGMFEINLDMPTHLSLYQYQTNRFDDGPTVSLQVIPEPGTFLLGWAALLAGAGAIQRTRPAGRGLTLR